MGWKIFLVVKITNWAKSRLKGLAAQFQVSPSPKFFFPFAYFASISLSLYIYLYLYIYLLILFILLTLAEPRCLAMKGGKSKAAHSNSTKLAVKKGGKLSKKAKDPNKPKRPPSAFFVFMEGFRKQYKESHPKNKSVAVVGKAGGDKWKSMSDAEKAPFQEQAEKRKKEYEKTMAIYNKKQAEGNADDDESDKSRSEVNDEDEDEAGSGEEEED